MDNRDFWYYIRVATLPDFNPLLVHAPSPSRPESLIHWSKQRIENLFRYLYLRFYDLIFAPLFGYLTLNEQLYIAVHQNKLEKARECLARGASPTFIPINPRSILKYFARMKPVSISYSIDPTLLGSINACDSMLFMAVSHNNFPLIRELVEYHNYGQIGHHTEVVSLCLAVKRGYDRIVEYLVDYAHIDPNDSVQLGCKHCKTSSENLPRFQFPLYHACRENRFNIVKYLIITKNCDINRLTITYETPLHGAILGAIENRFDTAINNQQRYQIVKYLLARPDCNPNLGLNPLCISLFHDNLYDYTSLLLQSKCHVDRLGWNYEERSNPCVHRPGCHFPYTLGHPLNICLQRLCLAGDNSLLIDYHLQRQNALNLIEHRPNIYAMSDFGSKYPLILAVQLGDKILVKTMLEQANDSVQVDLVEPLILACRRLYHEIVQMLVDFGFSSNGIKTDVESSQLESPSWNNLTGEAFLQCLERYCSPISPSRIARSPNFEQEATPFATLARMNPWIFHPDHYKSTMKTLANLVSHEPIDFSLRSNRFAFHWALVNSHVPLIYYCLANFCPVDLLHNQIEFNSFQTQNHFAMTLFHLISTCCRLTERNSVKRVLLDAYSRHILKIVTYDRFTSMKSVLAYLKLWFNDDDFVLDQTLFEHLVSLPYIDDIFQDYGENYLETFLGEYSSRFIEYRTNSKSVHSLKHLCRKKIRQEIQPNRRSKEKSNLLKSFLQLNCHLTNNLRRYLLYSRLRFKSQSNHLIDQLTDGIEWNSIQWI